MELARPNRFINSLSIVIPFPLLRFGVLLF